MPNCKACRASFTLSPEARNLLQKFPGEPVPRYCFPCAQKRRLMFRNGSKLYRRKCDSTGESILSSFSPEKPYTVYKAESWWSDKWDPKSFGRPFDFNRPFFEQFHELQLKVPKLALTNLKSENSEYCGMCEGNKNCYMIFGGDYNQDCLYGIFGMQNKDCADCDVSNHNERCYMMSDCYYCFGTQFAFDSSNCSECAFISNCIGCSDCILCTNQIKKSQCIRNTQYTKQEYERMKQELLSGSHSEQQKYWKEFLLMRDKRIVKHLQILKSEDCVGDYIEGSKDCFNCFETWDSQSVVDVILAFAAKDIYYSGCVGHKSELCYDTQSLINSYEIRHSYTVFESHDIHYCDFVMGSHDLFGCTGMSKVQYCILNKQYSKDEYEALIPRIIEHMRKTGEYGEFFPPECSCFGYNESTAMMYFPLEKKQAEAEGLPWFEATEEQVTAVRTIPASKLPDSISDTPDDIANWAVTSEESGKPFKIVPQELAFLRSMNIPIPRINFDERHRLRRSLRNPCILFDRTCAKCGKDIRSTYATNRPEIVYCESCYLKEVY